MIDFCQKSIKDENAPDLTRASRKSLIARLNLSIQYMQICVDSHQKLQLMTIWLLARHKFKLCQKFPSTSSKNIPCLRAGQTNNEAVLP